MYTTQQKNIYRKLLPFLSAFYIFLFVYTALSKLIELQRFKSVLRSSPLLSSYADVSVWLIPLMELIISALLFLPSKRKWGFSGVFVLMMLFTGYITYMIHSGVRLPCSCGGVIEMLSWQQHLVLNWILTILAAFALLLEFKNDLFIAINRRR